jgi:hypothetical protein
MGGGAWFSCFASEKMLKKWDYIALQHAYALVSDVIVIYMLLTCHFAIFFTDVSSDRGRYVVRTYVGTRTSCSRVQKVCPSTRSRSDTIILA